MLRISGRSFDAAMRRYRYRCWSLCQNDGLVTKYSAIESSGPVGLACDDAHMYTLIHYMCESSFRSCLSDSRIVSVPLDDKRKISLIGVAFVKIYIYIPIWSTKFRCLSMSTIELKDSRSGHII